METDKVFIDQRGSARLTLELETSSALEKQTTYQPSTGSDPSGKMDHDTRSKEVKREMEGYWTERDESLIDEFFPFNSVSQEDIQHVMRELYNPQQNRWKGIPNDMSKERDLVRAVLKIMTTIQRHFDIGPDRDVLDTQDHNIPTHDGATLKPDLYISCLGVLISPATVHETKPTSFKLCAGFMEAKRHKSRNYAEDAGQMATYAREVFMAQSNRRFVPCFLITERILEFFLFDRSGAIRSAGFDYHEQPERACATFGVLLKLDDTSLGFDHTISYSSLSTQCIRTMESTGLGETTYIVESLLMRSYTVVGLGTTYWRVFRERDPEPTTKYIIKDCWVTTQSENEQTLFEDIGEIDCVASLLHTQTVCTVSGSEDATVNNRLTKYSAGKTVNRVHKRTVYRSSGKLLEHFENPMQLLLALYRSIKGHGILFARGVLHRDIVPWNILIQSKTQDKESGALIDLDRATRTAAPSPRGEHTPGSWFFLPRSVLKGSTATSYMDDLEAFFYIFCFFVVAHTGPALASSRIHDSGDLEGYGSTPRIALSMKDSLFESDTFTYTVQTHYFKEPTAQLAVDLHGFFHKRWRAARDAKRTGEVLPPPNPTEDYQEISAHLCNAINKLSIICGNLHSMAPSDGATDAGPRSAVGGHIEEISQMEEPAVRATRKRKLSEARKPSRRDASRECKRVRRIL